MSKSQKPIAIGTGSLLYRGMQWAVVGQGCTEGPDSPVQEDDPVSEALTI